jgi:hypothetical protein
MTEKPEQAEADVPHDDELDVEAPNESAPGHNPEEPGEEAEEPAE